MKGKRYSEEQIVRILGEVESGRSVAETARQYGVSEGTIHRWRKKLGGMEISEVRRLRELQAENARLKRIVARRTHSVRKAMDIDALKELLRGKW
jgi:putative transposase